MAAGDNLRPYRFTSEQSREKAAEAGRKGGRASGVAKRKKKAMREVLEAMLSLPMKGGKVDKLKSFTDIQNANMTVEQAILAAQILKAVQKGDTRAATFIRDTAGQKILKDASDNNSQFEDDGFTEAIKASAKGVWD